MKKLLLLLGLLTIVAAGTTSAQTRVAVSIGFGVPRPYIAGDVFIGRSFVRSAYRPYYYYYPDRYPYYFYEPLPLRYGRPYRVIIFERDNRYYRREFDRERDWRRDWSRRHRGRDWDWRRDGDHDRDRDRDWDRNRRDRDHDHNR
jgi:hypothetical protein